MTLALTVLLALLVGTGETIALSDRALMTETIGGELRSTFVSPESCRLSGGHLALPALPFEPALSQANVLPAEGMFSYRAVRGGLAFWYKWWFPLLCVIVGATVIIAAHRLRLHQLNRKLNLRFEERLAERARVAHELHDALLQGVLSASMQLDVAVDQLPPNSPALPAMNRVLQLMGQVIGEGCNSLRGLRSSIESADDLKSSLSRVPTELGTQTGVDFRVVVEGLALPLRSTIRDDVFGIGREALVNAFRHSHARSIDLRLGYSASQLRVVVCDDGCGIDPQVLRSGRDGHWGLLGMRERADRIGAKVRVLSRVGGGTEIELRVPSDVAFESNPSRPVRRWFTRLHRPGQNPAA